MLYLVATPIGNLKDITLRSLEILGKVEGIICEDTRRTGLLLTHFQIKKPLFVLNDFNEVKVIPDIISILRNNQDLALVSDAGTPLISDPGYKLVRTCIEQEIPVDSIPGPSSILPALTLSGLPPDKFFYLGYFPEKEGQRLELIKKLPQINSLQKSTFIAFVAPHKLIKTLENLKLILGDIEIVLARELTKIYQTVKKQLISKWIEGFKNSSPKGEYILLFNLSLQEKDF